MVSLKGMCQQTQHIPYTVVDGWANLNIYLLLHTKNEKKLGDDCQ